MLSEQQGEGLVSAASEQVCEVLTPPPPKENKKTLDCKRKD